MTETLIGCADGELALGPPEGAQMFTADPAAGPPPEPASTAPPSTVGDAFAHLEAVLPNSARRARGWEPQQAILQR